MAQIGSMIGEHRLDDFLPVSMAAAEVGVIPQTIKRWLKNKTVPNVVWGRDRRKRIFVHRESVPLLKHYSKSIKVAS
jgi:hypothetical protein